MAEFNEERPCCGSPRIKHGRLKGATDNSDSFYFFCPKCPGREILRILEYGEHAKEPPDEYDDRFRSKAKHRFALVFGLHCEKCGFSDFVRISNMALQSGKHSEVVW